MKTTNEIIEQDRALLTSYFCADELDGEKYHDCGATTFSKDGAFDCFVSGYDRGIALMKQILEAEVADMEKEKKQIIKKKEAIQSRTNDPLHPARCQYLGQQDALHSRIVSLTNLINNLK